MKYLRSFQGFAALHPSLSAVSPSGKRRRAGQAITKFWSSNFSHQSSRGSVGHIEAIPPVTMPARWGVTFPDSPFSALPGVETEIPLFAIIKCLLNGWLQKSQRRTYRDRNLGILVEFLVSDQGWLVCVEHESKSQKNRTTAHQEPAARHTPRTSSNFFDQRS